MKGFLLLVFIFIILTGVSAQTVKVVYPNGGNRLESFTTTELLWEAVNIPFIDIAYSTDNGGSWQQIMSFYPAGQPLQWNIPGGNSDSCLLKITNSYNHSVFDLSDSTFSIHFNPSYDFIAANEVLMWVGNNGEGSHDPHTDGSGFYWPGGTNNSRKALIFSDGLWWGGKINGQVRAGGNTWRVGVVPGNINDTTGKAAEKNDPHFRIYKIKKGWEYLAPSTERDKYFYNALNWPIDLGAPWIDGDNNGIYSYGVDQPDYIGDEVLFYIANDLDTSVSQFSFGSEPIGLEFQTLTYAFNRSDLRNVVYKKYTVINKSKYNIENMYLSYWADCEVGDAVDDYEGFDTLLNMSYAYNSRNNDDVYGEPVPAVGHMLLQTPTILGTNSDSAFNNNKWVKGEKNVGMNSSGMVMKFSAYLYPRLPKAGTYDGSIEVYNMMSGLTNAGNSIINPLTNSLTKYPLSGDPVAGIGWYEGAGWPGGYPPGDRSYHLPCGPFNMAPGDTQTVVYAIFAAQGGSNIKSITELKKDAEYYRNQFFDNFPASIKEEKESLIPNEYVLYQNYPNPFNPSTKIKYSVPAANQVTLKVYDVLGREAAVLINKEMLPGSYEVDFNGAGFASGVYFYRLEAGGFVSIKKMVLIK